MHQRYFDSSSVKSESEIIWVFHAKNYLIMSRSYTSRPSLTNTRGRGRGTQTRNPKGPMENTDKNPGTDHAGRGSSVLQGGIPGQTHQGSTQPIGQRMTYQGGYTMITPNEKKRQQIAEMAKKEEAAYEAHRDKNTQKQLNYVGTVGGGQLTQAGARRQTAQNSPTKTTKLLEQQSRKSFMKQKEEEELQKKKAEQRLKAQQNAEREKREVNNWDEQRRRTNEAFLRRLENQSKHMETGNPKGDSAVDTNGSSHKQPDTSRTVIGKSAVGGTNQESESIPSIMGAVGGASACSNSGNNATSDDSKQGDMVSNNGLTTEEQKRLNALAMIFPDIDESMLIEILQQVGFDVDSAITLLQV